MPSNSISCLLSISFLILILSSKHRWISRVGPDWCCHLDMGHDKWPLAWDSWHLRNKYDSRNDLGMLRIWVNFWWNHLFSWVFLPLLIYLQSMYRALVRFRWIVTMWHTETRSDNFLKLNWCTWHVQHMCWLSCFSWHKLETPGEMSSHCLLQLGLWAWMGSIYVL